MYKGMYAVSGLDSGIPLANRGDPWDARPSVDVLGDAARAEQEPLSRSGHMRSDSSASVSTILGEKQEQPRSYIAGDMSPPRRQGTYASQRQNSIDQPMNAYTNAAQPTPYGYGNNYYSGPSYGGVEQPGRSQAHPGTSP